jgi:hypothetical protein
MKKSQRTIYIPDHLQDFVLRKADEKDWSFSKMLTKILLDAEASDIARKLKESKV